MKRIIGLALCLVLFFMSGCNLFNTYKETDPSSLDESGGTAPSQADALDYAKDYLSTILPMAASRISGGRTTDPKEALRLYLLSKAVVPKADSASMRHSTIKVTIDTDTPIPDDGTLQLKGSLEGKIPYDLLFGDSLQPSTAYTDITHFLLALGLNGKMTNIDQGFYTTVHGLLKDDLKLTADPSFTTDADAALDFETLTGSISLTLKMADGFSVLCSDGTGFKCTVYSDCKADADITNGDLTSFLQQIEITLKVYDDSNSLIDEETYTLDQLTSG